MSAATAVDTLIDPILPETHWVDLSTPDETIVVKPRETQTASGTSLRKKRKKNAAPLRAMTVAQNTMFLQQIEQLQNELDETKAQRDRFMSRLSMFATRMQQVQRQADESVAQMATQVQYLAAALGQIAFVVAAQEAQSIAAKRGSSKVSMTDVDEAISRFAEKFPDEVSQTLHQTRAALHQWASGDLRPLVGL